MRPRAGRAAVVAAQHDSELALAAGPNHATAAEIAGEASAVAALAGTDPRAETLDSSGTVIPLDLTAAAFFDVDNTMMVGASIFHFARGLAARKFFTTSDLAGFAWQQIKFRVG